MPSKPHSRKGFQSMIAQSRTNAAGKRSPQSVLFILAVGGILISISQGSWGEPYIAFREGLKCSACHVNNTGGGMRNGYGTLFTQTEITPLLESLSEGGYDFSAELNESISIGSDFMAVSETLLSEGDNDAQNTFDVESGNLYLDVRLIPDRLSVYIDETVAPWGASSREAFLLLEGLPNSSYIKAGRMLLPYGIRLWDDDSFIRQISGFNYDNQDVGIEVGAEPANFSLNVALSNGTQGARDDNSGKQISAGGSVFLGNVVLGGSFSRNKTSRGVERVLFGPYGSIRLGPATVMAEVDWISDSGAVDEEQFTGYASVEYWYRQAVNFRVAYDYLDPFDAVEEDEKYRVSIGFDAFLTPTLTAGAYYRLKESFPQDTAGNTDGLVLSLHAFF